MARIELSVPEALVESLPEDGENAASDMARAVEGWERTINQLLEDDPSALVDVVERFEHRWEQYDECVVELRAWGQSPIYAMAWRDLYEALVQQLYADDEVSELIDRERNARIVEDGIRPQH